MWLQAAAWTIPPVLSISLHYSRWPFAWYYVCELEIFSSNNLFWARAHDCLSLSLTHFHRYFIHFNISCCMVLHEVESTVEITWKMYSISPPPPGQSSSSSSRVGGVTCVCARDISKKKYNFAFNRTIGQRVKYLLERQHNWVCSHMLAQRRLDMWAQHTIYCEEIEKK